MKKVGIVLLIALLLAPTLATPAAAWRGGGHFHGGHFRGGCCWGGGGFFLGLGIGTLLTAPFWYPPAYAYPAYTYPAYSYPVYSYPAYSYPAYSYPAYSTYTYSTYAPVYTPPTAGTTPTPEPVSPSYPGSAEAVPAPPSGAPPQGVPQPPQTSMQNCQNVWVEGHYETRVMPNGQRVTSWIPAYSQQVCQ